MCFTLIFRLQPESDQTDNNNNNNETLINFNNFSKLWVLYCQSHFVKIIHPYIDFSSNQTMIEIESQLRYIIYRIFLNQPMNNEFYTELLLVNFEKCFKFANNVFFKIIGHAVFIKSDLLKFNQTYLNQFVLRAEWYSSLIKLTINLLNVKNSNLIGNQNSLNNEKINNYKQKLTNWNYLFQTILFQLNELIRWADYVESLRYPLKSFHWFELTSKTVNLFKYL